MDGDVATVVSQAPKPVVGPGKTVDLWPLMVADGLYADHGPDASSHVNTFQPICWVQRLGQSPVYQAV